MSAVVLEDDTTLAREPRRYWGLAQRAARLYGVRHARAALWRWALAGDLPSTMRGRPGAELPGRAVLALRVALLRILLPERFRRSSIRDLLAELTRASALPTATDRGEVERIEVAVEALLRENRSLRTTCLYRSLVRYVLLRQAGLDVAFAMGVTHDGGDLIGHAWLEFEGRPWREELKHDYQRTFTHP